MKSNGGCDQYSPGSDVLFASIRGGTYPFSRMARKILKGGLGVTVALFVLFSVRPAFAYPSLFFGGHRYERVDVASDHISWLDAAAAAKASGGYLASIGSAAEDAAIIAAFAVFTDAQTFGLPGYRWGPWIGLSAVPVGPGFTFSWEDGTTGLPYNGFAGGEPSGDGPGVHYFVNEARSPSTGWNDEDNPDLFPRSYIVEYQTPEPSTLALLLVGFAALMVVTRAGSTLRWRVGRLGIRRTFAR